MSTVDLIRGAAARLERDAGLSAGLICSGRPLEPRARRLRDTLAVYAWRCCAASARDVADALRVSHSTVVRARRAANPPHERGGRVDYDGLLAAARLAVAIGDVSPIADILPAFSLD